MPGDIVWASRDTESSRLARDPLPTERDWLEGRSHVTGGFRTVRRQRPRNGLTSCGDCEELLTRGTWISPTSTGRSTEAPRTRALRGGPAEESGRWQRDTPEKCRSTEVEEKKEETQERKRGTGGVRKAEAERLREGVRGERRG
ncbi:hypothetical protein NDU88_005857 [Pleurodeles waltl]|uniref:Uncharacterized protein n=1 Tax=Pleurodeles waltl TaxID=8319 RepID=A0AAV7X2H0_PLEWA|nr:hypothetical protein NDU88_005857 [Pleurodeles waltl]